MSSAARTQMMVPNAWGKAGGATEGAAVLSGCEHTWRTVMSTDFLEQIGPQVVRQFEHRVVSDLGLPGSRRAPSGTSCPISSTISGPRCAEGGPSARTDRAVAWESSYLRS